MKEVLEEIERKLGVIDNYTRYAYEKIKEVEKEGNSLFEITLAIDMVRIKMMEIKELLKLLNDNCRLG